MVGEEYAAGEFEKGREVATAFEVPLQAQGIKAQSHGCVCWLKDQKYGDGIERILEAPAQESWKMRVGENPSIAEACVEGACVLCAAWDAVSAASPDLNFVAAFFGSGLRVQESGRE